MFFFFFKQKTAYEMRISDCSSDVCSSDLIDHSGLLPKLVRDGFRGSIHTTTATADLLGVMLPDSAHIQESDARRAARRGHGAASEPIYTQRDVAACLAQVQAVDRSEEHTSELQSLMRISYAVFCLKKKINKYK